MRREKKLLEHQFVLALIAVLIGFIVAGFVLLAAGYNPFEVYQILFMGIFSKPRYMMNVIIKAAPIILTGVSVSFALKVGLFNIGVEGQYIMGTIFATITGLMLDLPAVLQFPLVILAGTAAGALYGALAGYLKAKKGINEVISGIMMNWIAFYLGNYISQLPRFRESGTTTTYELNSGSLDPIYRWKISDSGQKILQSNPVINDVFGRTSVNIGIIVAIVVAFAVAYLLNKMSKGYELRAVGLNKTAAKAAGIDVNKNTIQTLLIAGAIAGLAGALSITGVSHKLYELMALENYGFNGLSVALMAGGSPIGSIFSGLLFAGLNYGGGTIQLQIGAPSEIIDILIGTIVFCMALVTVIPMFLEKYKKKGDVDQC